MRGLIVLCLIATAFAAPQYNYEQQTAATSYGGNGGGFGAASGPAPAAAQVTYNKQFYIHSAPEEDDYDRAASQEASSSLRRNLRVVFVKSPENKGLENAALQLAKSASEDKTAIYVLNKQTDLSELQNKLSQIQDINANKPEVHFIKYKTPQEAEHAQHTIQAQYDQLGGGPSQVSNEGIAPVRSFIGSLGNQGSFGGASNGGFASASHGSAAYLPPNFRFRH